MIFGVKKFHSYLSGINFTMLTDHRPLLGVFGPEKAIPNMASSRMIRWALILQGYSYGLRHKAGSRNQNADALSRIPLGEHPAAKSRVPVPQETINLIEMLNSGPITATEIFRSTGKDPILARVHRYLLTGGSRDADPEIAKFYSVILRSCRYKRNASCGNTSHCPWWPE